LQASINQPDPAAYIQAQLWDSTEWSDQAAMYMQLIMAAQADDALTRRLVPTRTGTFD